MRMEKSHLILCLGTKHEQTIIPRNLKAMRIPTEAEVREYGFNGRELIHELDKMLDSSRGLIIGTVRNSDEIEKTVTIILTTKALAKGIPIYSLTNTENEFLRDISTKTFEYVEDLTKHLMKIW